MQYDQAKNITLSLLRCWLAGEKYEGTLSAEAAGSVLALAARHDVAHLVCLALQEPGEALMQARQKAIYRYLRQDYEREQIYALFESEQIPFIPLKGSVVCGLYPEAWQRTGCDIDILVRHCDLDKARAALEGQLGFVFRIKSAHDYSLISPNGVHLELHYAFDEHEVPLDEVWESAKPLEQGCMQQTMKPELFVLHHIAHMAKHFRSGGCGLRPFVDLWLMQKELHYDADELEIRLNEAGLRSFAHTVLDLLQMWFAEGACSELLLAAEEYILPAGTYGSIRNHVAVGQLQKGGKGGYFLSRLFLKTGTLAYSYPVLEKHRWLMPFCQVHRWFRLLMEGKLQRIRSELNANSSIESDYVDGVKALLKALEL